MSVGFEVGDDYWTVGAASFVFALFSTITGVLEPDGLGSRFPRLANDLFDGELKAEDVAQAREELRVVRAELAEHRPTDLVWDYTDPSNVCPWADELAVADGSLATYFVTSDNGSDVFATLDEVLEHAERQGLSVVIS